MSKFPGILSQCQNHIVAIDDASEVLTCGELADLSSNISKLMDSRSVVCCLCNNTFGALGGYIGFLENRIVPIMIDSSIDDQMLTQIHTSYDAEYIWLPQERVPSVACSEAILSFKGYSLVRALSTRKLSVHKDLALLLSTSGSTGSPKFVRLSYKNLEANANSIATYLGIDESERPVTTLPMSYSYGLSVINSHIISGATILLTTKSVIERAFWEFINTHKATSLSGVPYTFEMLKRLRFFEMYTPHLNTLTQAGGKLHEELISEFSSYCEESGKKMFVMYGQTEATARMSYLSPHHSVSKLGSIGVPIPGGEFSLIDDQGNAIIENNVAGELVYKGDNVSLGYAYCLEDLAKGDENDGVLRTGDVAIRDSDGFYYIVGRKSRFIKIYGNRVNLDETEQLIKYITDEVACVGSDDNLVIYITDENLIETVRSFISKRTGINFRAFQVKVVSSIPKSNSGKINYAGLDI